MKEQLLKYLKCLVCNESNFAATAEEKDSTEIRKGTLICKKCDMKYTINDGIAKFLIDAPQEILNEIKGKTKGLNAGGRLPEMSTEEHIVNLPFGPPGLGYGHYESLAANFYEMLEKMHLGPGVSILDVGASNCWAAYRFAEMGCHAVATDISTVLYSGLSSADFFLKKGTYFERVQADMHRLPFVDESFDYVFFNNVLHHSSNIETVLDHAYELLKMGGKLVLVGEPSYGLLSKKEEFGKEKREEFHANENIYPFFRYKRVIKKAGFGAIQLFFPPAIDLKLSTGKYGWKRVNKNLFAILHFLWKAPVIRTIFKKVFMVPMALLYNFQVHCIAEKR